ncbi:MAG TPA: OmpA family protein [Pseudobdellovibrionaceae bacterium]|nr:OmpA family protein [Pseudobdellovibrionaceae bacterium]
MLNVYKIGASAFLTMSLLLSSAAMAEGQVSSAKVESSKLSRVGNWTGFLGLGAGLTETKNNTVADGLPASVKVLGSYLTTNSNYVFDLGLGLNNQQFTNAKAKDTAATGGVLEAAARYQTPSHWQFGLVGNSFYNQGVNYQANQGDAHFIGAQVLKEFALAPKWIGRLGARAMALANAKDESAAMMMIDFQIGWGGSAAPQVTETNANVANATSETPISNSTVMITNSNGKTPLANFKVGDDTLETNDKAYLMELSKVLKANSNLFGKIRVKGYADISGNDAINEKVSQNRATKAASILSELNQNKVEALGMGVNKNSKHVHAEDRKIEIELLDIKNQKALESALKTINK